VVSEAAVAAYLAERLDAPVVLTSLRQTFPGMSRETWIVAVEVGEGAAKETRDLVVRVDPPSGGGVPVPLKVEWEVFRRLWGSPVPVAEPLWYDEGIDFAEGRPHFVRVLVDGSPVIPGLHRPGPEGDALRRATAFEHAEKLAIVHTLDWKAYGFDEFLPAPQSPAQAVRHDFDIWKQHWFDRRTAPFPGVTEIVYWLEELIPTDSPRISLFKGNNGLNEEIFKDGKIVAMSDWELAGLGDPAQDWAFSQGMLGLYDEEATLAHYEEAAGFRLSRRTLAFYKLFMRFKAIVCLNSTMGAFIDGRDLRAVLPFMGLGSVKNMEYSLGPLVGKSLDEATAMMSAGRRAARNHREEQGLA